MVPRYAPHRGRAASAVRLGQIAGNLATACDHTGETCEAIAKRLIPDLWLRKRVLTINRQAQIEQQPLAALGSSSWPPFADQAVIAIENVRLFEEIQEKSRQLAEASQHKSRSSPT